VDGARLLPGSKIVLTAVEPSTEGPRRIELPLQGAEGVVDTVAADGTFSGAVYGFCDVTDYQATGTAWVGVPIDSGAPLATPGC
jgi:hypothetical protein